MSTKQYSNVEEVYAAITEAVGGFDLHHNGAGMDMIEKVVTGIQLRSMAHQCTWDGESWPNNSAEYLAYKKRYYDSGLINYRTGQMLSQESLMGEWHVGEKMLEIRYGTGRPPDRSMNGYMEPCDELITDREKADRAIINGRGFFDLDDEIKDETFNVFSDAFAKHLRDSLT